MQRETVRRWSRPSGRASRSAGRANARELRRLPRARRARVVLGSPRSKDADLVRALAFEHPGVVDRGGRREGRLRRRRRVDATDARARGRPGPVVRRRAAGGRALHGRGARRDTRRTRTSRPRRSSRRRSRSRHRVGRGGIARRSARRWPRAASLRASSAARSTTGPSRSTKPSKAAVISASLTSRASRGRAGDRREKAGRPASSCPSTRLTASARRPRPSRACGGDGRLRPASCGA